MARPRIHPTDDATARKRHQRQALRQRGGRVLSLTLEPDDVAALDRIRAALMTDTAAATDADAIRHALRACASVRNIP